MKRPAGRFFCGFLVSPALAVAASQPLKAQSEATRAMPKLLRRFPENVPTAGVTKLAGWPLAKMKITPQIPARPANLITVRMFWRFAPQRVPA